MFQQFFLKTMLSKQLAGLPPETRDMVMNAIMKNPDFFKKLAEDIKKRMDGGMPQMMAVKTVFESNKDDLARLMKPQ